MAKETYSSNQKHFSSEECYSSEEIKNVTFDDGTTIMTAPSTDIKRPICAGIDVHKKLLVAAVCITDTNNLTAKYYVRKFKTTNSDIRSMARWMAQYGVKDVCMESTGKYWIPVFNLVEQNGLKPVLTHPKYVKQAKGCKTDFRDAVHIANLFRMDLVVSSFIPPSEIRDLRELIRYRLKLVYIRTSEKNRYQNSMTISQIRLDNVFSDPFGKSASAIMSYLLCTEPEKVEDSEILARIDRRVKAEPEKILDSIHGYEFVGIQRDKLRVIEHHLENIYECLDYIDDRLNIYRSKYAEIIQHLTTMVGITEQSALYILAEIGTDMSVWKNSDSLASWAGLSPANNESGGKKKSTRIGKGGHYLKPLLVQCAYAAVKSKKNPYFKNKYNTIAKRRGNKKAIIAIARKMLVSIYHMIKYGKDFSPIDYHRTVISQNTQPVTTLEKVVEFLGVHGIDNATIDLVKEKCSVTEKPVLPEEKASDNEEKQPSSSAEKKSTKKPTRKTPRKSTKSTCSDSDTDSTSQATVA